LSNRVNLMSPEVRANPYPFYAELRKNAPVSQVEPGGMWAVTRYDDVVTVCKDATLFSCAGLANTTEQSWLQDNPLGESLIFLDPPQHGRLKTLVTRAFGPAVVTRLEPHMRALAAELTNGLVERRSVDFVEAFSVPMPARVIAPLLGLDQSLHSRFMRWAHDLTSGPATRPDDVERQAQIRATVVEMKAYLGEVLESRRRTATGDLVSDLVRTQINGESLTDRELMGFLFVLLVAGLDTTVHLLSHSVRVLMEHPDVLARLRAEPALIPKFIEELLRYEPPVHGMVRLTTADVTLGGVHLPKYSPLVALVGSATRDEAYHPDGDRFNLDRTGQTSMPFGHGAHFCIGSHLAKMEARVTLEAMLPRIKGFAPGAGPVEWNMSMIVRGPTRLPVEIQPA